MKVFCCFIALLLFFGFTGAAKASSIDFGMRVLDPSGFSGTTVTSDAFPVTFSACPTTSLGEGCFFGLNGTSDTFTSLDMTFPNNSFLNGQTAGCDTSVSGSLFGSSSCGLVGSNYQLDFSGGTGIAPNAVFIISETGVTPADFPVGSAIVGVTPEPDSLLLMSTGLICMLAFMFGTERGRALRASLLPSC